VERLFLASTAFSILVMSIWRPKIYLVFLYIYLHVQFIILVWAKESRLKSPILPLHFFGSKLIAFILLVTKLSLLLLHWNLCPIFAKVRAFFWKRKYGWNLEHSIPTFDDPTTSFLKNGTKSIFSQKILLRIPKHYHRRTYLCVLLVSIYKSLPVWNLGFSKQMRN
jgi:hypothetical protein